MKSQIKPTIAYIYRYNLNNSTYIGFFLIVLGKKYKFTERELKLLSQKNKTVSSIDYKKLKDEEIIKSIEKHIRENELIVLNTRAKVSNEVIKYLTRLELNGIKYISIEHFLEKYLQKCYIPDSHNDLHYLEDITSYSTWQYFQKRFIDYFGVFWLCFFSWPIFIMSKMKIQEQSPGKVFFKQDRVGKNASIFQCIKFRTMHENSHHDPYTREQDKRVFLYGEKMRKARIDELPQIWNILKGEMHLIGPRAEWNILVNEYESKLPYYHERHLVAPGITGWAQVNYPYGQNLEDTKQKLMYDLYYIKHWSILLELTIVWKTAMTVLKKQGV